MLVRERPFLVQIHTRYWYLTAALFVYNISSSCKKKHGNVLRTQLSNTMVFVVGNE